MAETIADGLGEPDYLTQIDVQHRAGWQHTTILPIVKLLGEPDKYVGPTNNPLYLKSRVIAAETSGALAAWRVEHEAAIDAMQAGNSD
ncbi:MAG TPA: hypothetical protein VHY35_10575 [Stellaceae bacterium]|jgi:hypothetical protein|nr:hypothetical protein [Stellaceae bacterium]